MRFKILLRNFDLNPISKKFANKIVICIPELSESELESVNRRLKKYFKKKTYVMLKKHTEAKLI